MVVAPGRKRTKTVISKFHSQTQLIAQTIPMPIWIRPFAVSLGGNRFGCLSWRRYMGSSKCSHS